MDIKQILSEATNGALNEEVLSEIENVFEKKVNDKVEIHVEAALNEQDELYTQKLNELVVKIDEDHSSKLKSVVNALDLDRSSKLKMVIEKYEEALNIYRSEFRPSEKFSKPLVNVCMWALTANTNEEAKYLFASRAAWKIGRNYGQLGSITDPDNALSIINDNGWTEQYQNMYQNSLVGDANICLLYTSPSPRD